MAQCLHIAVNSRLSQLLKQQLLADVWSTQTVAETPKVMTLSQWWQHWEQQTIFYADEASLSALWSPRRLSAYEAEMLWQDVLSEAMQQQAELRLLNVRSTAKQLYQAWCFLLEYQTESKLEDHFKTEEVALFLRLKNQYLQHLNQFELLDPPLLEAQRLELLERFSSSSEYTHIQLHGFDELSPSVKRWQSLLIDQGLEVEQVAVPTLSVAPKQQLCQAATPEQEAQQVALWCADQLESWLKHSSSETTPIPQLGIVAPNIESVQSALTWALDETFYQRFGQSLPLKSGRQALYNISLGQPLTQSSLVQNALQTLQMALAPHQTLRYEDWSEWLTSPYTLGDLQIRQQADSRLRKLQWASFKWPVLIGFLQEAAEKQDATQTESKLLTNPLPRKLINLLVNQSKKRLASQVGLSQFVQQARIVLNDFQWGGVRQLGTDKRALNTTEMQQKETFLQQLTQFENCYFQNSQASYMAWLGRFKQHLQGTLHQSQTEGWVPIQIMGMLEASGQRFDALWVMGLTDEAWPRMPSPNPFLPIRLQRDLAMPRCDASRELHYAEQVTQRLSQAAPSQVWSWASQLEGKELLPSPLLSKRQLATLETDTYANQIYCSLAEALRHQAAPLVWVEDRQAPEIPLNTVVPGGTGILNAQNSCPLMAFIEYRLGARYQLEAVEDGMQANHLGTLVHQVLERFWQSTQTQANLLAMSGDLLVETVSSLLEQAIEPIKPQLDAHYLSLEKQRIQQLIIDWLSLEKTRPPFAVVETEAEHQLALGGLLFNTKIDRVDQLLEFANQKLIIDYKTGRANVADLLKEPIEAPQLAVYLQAFSLAEIAGLGYGILHSDDGVKLDVLVEEAEVLPECRQVFSKLAEKADGDFEGQAWSDFLTELQAEVDSLARSLQQGDATMAFRDESVFDFAAGKLALRLPEVKWQQSARVETQR